ncbi:MAG: DNA repair protein RadC [Treponema sp.]|nr:DNA repair protein RadC [Treponema sp.]
MYDENFNDCVNEVPGDGYRAPFISDFQSLPISERPRERLLEKGPAALMDQELLAIVLGHGVRGKNVSVLAFQLLDRLDNLKEIPSAEELVHLGGMGTSKACTVIAMLELGRRYWNFSGVRIRYPSDCYNIVRHYASRKQEMFISISLNGSHEVIAVRVVSKGLVNRTIVHPREVFADPLTDRCSAVCVCHNHPSGELVPSREDDEVTVNLAAAAEILGIRFLDHLIFSDKSFYSYRREKRLRDYQKTSWSCEGSLPE